VTVDVLSLSSFARIPFACLAFPSPNFTPLFHLCVRVRVCVCVRARVSVCVCVHVRSPWRQLNSTTSSLFLFFACVLHSLGQVTVLHPRGQQVEWQRCHLCTHDRHPRQPFVHIPGGMLAPAAQRVWDRVVSSWCAQPPIAVVFPCSNVMM
jgi:hypothetical protein